MVLFTDTNSFMYEIKSEDIYEDCGNNERTFRFSNSSTHSNPMIILTNQSLGNDKTATFTIQQSVRLNPRMYSFLVDDNSEHKKAKGMNRNNVATINYNKYTDVLLNNKCIRHSINRI